MFEVFFMNEKIDNTLNIALNLPEEDLEKSQELSVGRKINTTVMVFIDFLNLFSYKSKPLKF